MPPATKSSLGQRVMVLAKKGEDPKKVVESLGLGQGSAGGRRQDRAATPASSAAAAAPSHSDRQRPAGARRRGPAQPVGGRLKASPLARKWPRRRRSTWARCAAPARAAGSSAATSRHFFRASPRRAAQPRHRARSRAVTRLPRRNQLRSPGRPSPLWLPSVFHTRGCARRSPSACSRPSRPLPRST